MQFVTVCRSCGRTIENDFVYCPWCGLTQLEPTSFNNEMDSIFSKLEQMQKEDCNRRILKLGHSLDVLESDLTNIMIAEEVHK